MAKENKKKSEGKKEGKFSSLDLKKTQIHFTGFRDHTHSIMIVNDKTGEISRWPLCELLRRIEVDKDYN